MTPTALDYDPPAQAREWFRHVQDGQLGWKVIRAGKTMIKLDRVAQPIEMNYRETDWIAETEHRPLTRWQIAKVAFEADKALCIALGDVAGSKRQWLDLRDEARQRWIEKGPVGSTPEARVRQGLFASVMLELAPLALEQ